ncbi:hypothetical protein ABZT06_50075 [Streptomyces sp. NPDC005483]|uniref:Rv1733c family protein n=1 Tax=Streptomyces sp. NPDC005483 TaxID=3154882 RepID=UPI0033B6B7BF
MRRSMPTRKRFWRWRSNPLRRHDDVVESWIVLAVGAVVAVGGTFAGLVTAHAADEVLARQRAERHAVHAVLVTDLSRRTSSVASSDGKAVAKVRWTAPDGAPRTGRTLVGTGLRAGDGLVVWLDGHGTPTTAPPSTTEAQVEAGVLGAGAGLALAGAVCAAGAVVRWRLERRRIEGWGREWDLVEPTWGHRTG